jgi:hypothetical protein
VAPVEKKTLEKMKEYNQSRKNFIIRPVISPDPSAGQPHQEAPEEHAQAPAQH